MTQLIISTAADQDLLEVWLYIAEDNIVNADRFLDKFNEKALKLAEFSGMGVDRSGLSEGVRSFSVERYVLFYRVFVDGID